MASQSYQFVMRTGPNPGKSFPLTKDDLSLGRDISNDIVINDAEISRHHARIYKQAGGFVLEDTGSTNGTFINGQRLMGPHLLRPGEMILLGENISLIFEAYQFDPDATIASNAIPDMPSYQQPPAPAPSYPPPQSSYGQMPPPAPVQAQEPPVQAYAGTVPPGPEEEYQEAQPQRNRNWLYIGCGCAVLIICVLVVGAVVFDQLNLYCTPPFNGFFPCP
jgi:FHA domain